jgi:hypothetical protein
LGLVKIHYELQKKIASEADLVWRKPKGDFIYGKFTLKEMDFNCSEYK